MTPLVGRMIEQLHGDAVSPAGPAFKHSADWPLPPDSAAAKIRLAIRIAEEFDQSMAGISRAAGATAEQLRRLNHVVRLRFVRLWWTEEQEPFWRWPVPPLPPVPRRPFDHQRDRWDR